MDPIPNVYVLQNLGPVNQKPTFYIAINEEKSQDVVGVLLIRKGLRGHPVGWLVSESIEAATELAKLIQFPEGSIWTTNELGKVLDKQFDDRIKSRIQFNVMRLDRLRKEFETKHKWRRLTPVDFYQWARMNIMMNREESGEENTVREPTNEELESAKSFLDRSIVFGIFDGDELISMASVEVLSQLDSAIRRVFTRPKYRGQGFAKSVTLVSAKEALEHSERALLFVRKDNYAAIKVYDDIGFSTVTERIQYAL